MLNLKVKNEINALQIISKIAESFSPFEVTVEKADVFLNDSATGGHTLFFRIKKNKFINDLQLSLANGLQNERVVIPPPKHIIKNKIFLNSFNEYGSFRWGALDTPFLYLFTKNKPNRSNNKAVFIIKL